MIIGSTTYTAGNLNNQAAGQINVNDGQTLTLATGTIGATNGALFTIQNSLILQRHFSCKWLSVILRFAQDDTCDGWPAPCTSKRDADVKFVCIRRYL